MKLKKGATFIILFLFAFAPFSFGNGQGSWFVFSQLKFPGNWDPYPRIFSQIRHYLVNTTSLRVEEERRILELKDKDLFYSPFLIFTGRGGYPAFSESEIVNLRRYISGGGLLVIDTAADESFSRSVNRTMQRVFPDREFKRIENNHAIFRSFYLIEYVSGLDIKRAFLEGIEVEGRLAVVKSENNIFGIWERDRMGNFAHEPVQGRRGQRKEAIKLTLNLAIYSVTGTYKSDPVHQPHIKRKLGR